MATISDIASMLNIDTSTVSRALNDSRRISDLTKKKVWDAAKKLNYHVNRQASSLASRKTRTIAVVLNHYDMLQNYVTGGIVAGIGELLMEHEYDMIMAYYVSQAGIPALVNRLFGGNRVEGVIVIGGVKHEIVKELEKHADSIVMVNTLLEASSCISVGVDDLQVGYLGAKYLINRGCQFPKMLNASKEDTPACKRAEGFRRALEEAGIKFTENHISWCMHRTGIEYGAEAGIYELAMYPETDGFYCYSDIYALGAIRSVVQAGRHLGKDFFIVGTDDITISKALTPALTTIQFDPLAMGRLATQILFEQFDNVYRDTTQINLDVKLIVRET